jgi:hypothetical protein
MALALAIFALVVVGALVVGAFLAGHLEQRTGRGTLYAAQAADAAEAGAVETLADWSGLGLNSMAPGSTVSLPPVAFAGRSGYQPTVSRLNDQLFLVRSLGVRSNAAGGTLARRSVAIVARLVSLGAGPEAALTVGRPVDIAGDEAAISGADDCAPGTERPGTRTLPSSSQAFALFGDVTFDRLAAHARVVLPDTTLASAVRPSLASAENRCDTDEPSNWGEPRRSDATAVAACRTYYPVIHATGARLGITGGGRGQGILLVDGDLAITGDFDFTGLIVVRGGVRIAGGRTRITGGLMAAGASADSRNAISGAATLRYSSCALREALSGAAFVEPLGQRSWVQAD